MNFICDDFDDSVIEEIRQIIEPNLEDLIKSSEPEVNSDWQSYLSEDSLMSIIDQEVPHNRNKNLSRPELETPGMAVEEVVKRIYPDRFVWCSGYFYYPPTGFMGWHTNHNDPAVRIYINYSSEDKKSFFRYYHNGKIITDYDRKGVNVRRFLCSGSKPYLWHCVGSECHRISIGFTIKYHTKYLKNVMAQYAIIENEKVINIVEWNGDTDIWSPPSGTTTALIGDASVGIGMTYKSGSFVIPSVTSVDPTTAEHLVVLREKRNKLLVESDWTQGFDVPVGIRTSWQSYRQNLRDLPGITTDFGKVPWPTKPS